jgi:hypothetical protein
VQMDGFYKMIVAGDLVGINARSAEAELVLSTKAAARDPLSASMIGFGLAFGHLFVGDSDGHLACVLTN